MTVHWYVDYFPEEIRQRIDPLLTRWLHIVPGWCGSLKIDWDDSDNECSMKAVAHPEYRRGEITVCPAWLSAKDPEGDVVHELIHMPLMPMVNFVDSIVEKIHGEDEKMAEFVEECWALQYEGAVEDLRISFMGRAVP